MTEFILDLNKVILTENFKYRRLPKEGQEFVINSNNYSVIRSNVLTNGNIQIFIQLSKGKRHESYTK